MERDGEGNGNPLQYSRLENPRDRGAWWAAIYGVSQSWTWLKRLSSRSSSYGVLPVQLLSCVRLFATPWIAARQASLSITNSWSLLKLMSIKSVMQSSHLILCRPLLILPPIPPSIRVFSRDPEGSGIGPLQIHWPLVITKKPWSSLLMIIVVFINWFTHKQCKCWHFLLLSNP